MVAVWGGKLGNVSDRMPLSGGWGERWQVGMSGLDGQRTTGGRSHGIG